MHIASHHSCSMVGWGVYPTYTSQQPIGRSLHSTQDATILITPEVVLQGRREVCRSITRRQGPTVTSWAG